MTTTVNAIGTVTPIPVNSGGTGLAAITANDLLYASATNVITGLPPSSSSVLTSTSGGAPA